MALILNPRGPSGSGKTELVRRILMDYGWKQGDTATALYRWGRKTPIGYRLPHPHSGRPLAVLGHYEKKSGGCDTISASDGGMDEISRLANDWVSSGHDVLLEGSVLSSDHRHSVVLAQTHRMHLLILATSTEESARNLAVRRHIGRSKCSELAGSLSLQRHTIEIACDRLRDLAEVEELSFRRALDRSRELLGLSTSVRMSQRELLGRAI